MLGNSEIQKVETLHITKINYTTQVYFSFVPKFDLKWNKKKFRIFFFVNYLKNVLKKKKMKENCVILLSNYIKTSFKKSVVFEFPFLNFFLLYMLLDF